MISNEIVKKSARLARLNLTLDEVDRFTEQLSLVVEAFAKLQEVDTTGVEPMVTPIEIVQRLRPDEVHPWGGEDEVLANAPERRGNLFKVPPVV